MCSTPGLQWVGGGIHTIKFSIFENRTSVGYFCYPFLLDRKVREGTTFCDLRHRPDRPVLLRFRQSKVCSEVKNRLLLHLAANSAALDQANNGSIGFVGE